MKKELDHARLLGHLFEEGEHELGDSLRQLASHCWSRNDITADQFERPTAGQFDFEPVSSDQQSARDFLDELRQNVLPRAINAGSPYYIGHMNPLLPNVMHSLAGLVTALNQNTVKQETSLALSAYERQALASIHQLIYGRTDAYYEQRVHHAETTLGICTSGGTIANLTALWAARTAFQKNGEKPIRIIGSTLAHYSISKAAAVLGLSSDSIVPIETNDDYTIDLQRAEEAMKECAAQGHRIVIIGVAGSTECGSIDPLADLADLAERYGAFFHVDAAWGGAMLLSEKHIHLLCGIERADSVTIDGHKQLCTPMGLGMVFFKDETLASHIEHSAQYIIRKDSMDLGKRSLEGSRPANVIYLQAALKLLGRQGFEALLNRSFENARFMADQIEQSDDFELVCAPKTNLLLYRFLPEAFRGQPHYTVEQETALDHVNAVLQSRQFMEGRTFVSRTNITLPGYKDTRVCALRAVFNNPTTTEKHIIAVLDDQRRIANQIFKSDYLRSSL